MLDIAVQPIMSLKLQNIRRFLNKIDLNSKRFTDISDTYFQYVGDLTL